MGKQVETNVDGERESVCILYNNDSRRCKTQEKENKMTEVKANGDGC